MKFTNEEFNIMVDELLNRETVSFNMLCRIAEKSLRPTVIYWCYTDDNLRGRDYEEDILQEIYMRLITTTVNYFLLRNGPDGPVNDDPQGFSGWMLKVAMNIKRDFSNRVRKSDFKTDELDELHELQLSDENDYEDDRIETLKKALQIVLEADAGIYKTLTWLAQFVFMLCRDISKIESNDVIVDMFEHKTLREMYKMILESSTKIRWLKIDRKHHIKITEALNTHMDDNTLYGDVEYGEFFMKKGGKKSISDWVNRMNNTVRRSLKNGTSEH